MTGDKNKNIVEEVFSRSMNVDDRISALFACFEHPPQDSLEEGQKSPSDLKESPAAKDTGSSDNKPFQSAKGARHESLPERTIKNKDSTRRVRTVVVAGFAVLVLAFFVGGYLVRQGTASTKTMPQEQYVNRSEIISPLETEPLLNVPPEPVPEKINKNSMSMALDWQHFIDWSSLLDEISVTIPKTVQLSVIESGDGSEMFLEGEALSTDAVYDFVDALGTNRQVESAELTKTGIGKGESQDMLTFSINCSLVSGTKTPGSVDGDYDNSGLDRSRLFTPKEAETFFDSIEPVLEDTGCMVKSLLISPKDAVFEDEKANGRITKRHAAITLQSGYQNISKVVEKLQNRSQGVWLDSFSIKQGSGTGRLECSMGISVYVAEGAG